MFDDAPGEKILLGADTAATLEAVASVRSSGRKVAVLVSGDPGLFSLAQKVVQRFGRDACGIISGISSVQVAFARVGLDWTDAHVLSAHGRTPTVSPDELLAVDKLAILAGNREALQWSAEIADGLRTTHAIFLCENLTLEDERIRLMEPEQLERIDAASLSIVLILRRTLL
jgi:precorrin-6y C5,15-methyltransferase (decarboxylating) CbiE subunit